MFLKHQILVFSLVFINLTTASFSEEVISKSYNQNDVKEKLISFSNLENLTNTFDEESYINTIRESVINQPEYRSSIALSEEKRLLLANAKREFFPTLSSRIINDEIIDKSIAPTDSIRKRQDDSFDAVVEFNQNLTTKFLINLFTRAGRPQAPQAYSGGRRAGTLFARQFIKYVRRIFGDYSSNKNRTSIFACK